MSVVVDRQTYRQAWVMKTAAKRLGIPLSDYARHVLAGGKWCSGCKAWHPRDAFGIDRKRGDQRYAVCRIERNRRTRLRYTARRLTHAPQC